MKPWKHYAIVFAVAALGMATAHCAVLAYEDHVMIRALWAYANKGAQQAQPQKPAAAPSETPPQGGK